MNTSEIFTSFVAAINGHDVAVLAALLVEDHVFVDSLGNRVQGRAAMEAGWRGYFGMCPDYWLKAETVMVDEETVLAAGEAGGTINGTAWRIPAAWKALIRDRKVAEWRVFADNKPVYDILAKLKQ